MLKRFLALFRKPPPEPPAAPALRHPVVPSWQSLRGPEQESDRLLSADAQRWLELLPDATRPEVLCAAHPRIANRLAHIWADRPVIKLYFDDLLFDRRPGRIGFAADVREELSHLREYHEAEMRDAAALRNWKQRFAQARKASRTAPP